MNVSEPTIVAILIPACGGIATVVYNIYLKLTYLEGKVNQQILQQRNELLELKSYVEVHAVKCDMDRKELRRDIDTQSK